MYTFKYKSGFIHGHCDKECYSFVIEGVYVSPEYNTLHQCKINMTRYLASLSTK